jgi:hypothetical protein
MPQGILTAPAWFMCMVAEILKKHISKNYCIVFMDDISIYSDSIADHERYVQVFMDTLRKYSFRLKDAKCTFG